MKEFKIHIDGLIFFCVQGKDYVKERFENRICSVYYGEGERWGRECRAVSSEINKKVTDYLKSLQDEAENIVKLRNYKVIG